MKLNETKIDKNVPIPPKQAPEKSLMELMEVNDSVLVNADQARRLKYQAEKLGMKTTKRIEGPHKHRVWRIK
jgi:hypothetical protein